MLYSLIESICLSNSDGFVITNGKKNFGCLMDRSCPFMDSSVDTWFEDQLNMYKLLQYLCNLNNKLQILNHINHYH